MNDLATLMKMPKYTIRKETVLATDDIHPADLSGNYRFVSSESLRKKMERKLWGLPEE